MTHFPFEINIGGCRWPRVTAARGHIYWNILTPKRPTDAFCIWYRHVFVCIHLHRCIFACVSPPFVTTDQNGHSPFNQLNSRKSFVDLLKEYQWLVVEKEQTLWAKLPQGAGGQRWVHPQPPEPVWMSGGCEATWPKRGAAVINAPCLGCRHRNETDEGSGWWMRAGARADKTWPMNLFYIIGSFDHWQKFRDGPVHLSKQTKASSLPEPSLTPKHCDHLPPPALIPCLSG